ncbi:hypothetical protein HANVADRAFT_51169 [Hanseniaspora valbyensis NRRL Y-1626]|uniref:Single-stranded DNA-binding protein n=1 Tax=Hanseniaspora valbyensis NRRL Y-1626 TaxID=766949 RepID=A0A1B7TIW9_9ASCO|nr:hypothetical protein HANVADRAFT_51169 [Hanseniaspora valbyensis NRRL Y-1626]
MFQSISKRTFSNTAINRYAKFQVIGRLGADAVKRVSANGTEFYSYNIASILGKKDAKTTWLTVSAFSPPDFFLDAMKKGNLVYVEGKITSFETTKEDGEKVYGHNYTQDNFKILDSKRTETSE